MKSRTEAYSSDSGKKDSSLAERVGTGASIIDMFNEIDDILENELDKFVNKFNKKGKTFYEGYYAAGNIKDLGKHYNSKKNNSGTKHYNKYNSKCVIFRPINSSP